MGNCVVLLRLTTKSSLDTSPNHRILRVVKVDGKVLEYRASVLVRDLLSNFDGLGVGVSREASRCLPSNHELKVGSVYYLLPSGTSNCTSADLNPSVKGEEEKSGGCKRIKVVMTKQQLQELLSKSMSVEELLSGVQRREEQSSGCVTSWKPQLETIPEGSD